MYGRWPSRRCRFSSCGRSACGNCWPGGEKALETGTRRRRRRLLARLGYPPQRQIDPATLGEPARQESGGAWIDAIDAVKGEAGGAAEDDHVARGQLERARRDAPLAAADPEQAAVAQRDRHDGGREVSFVGVLVEAEARRRRVVVDEAGFRRARILRNLLPEIEDGRRHRRPRPAGD